MLKKIALSADNLKRFESAADFDIAEEAEGYFESDERARLLGNSRSQAKKESSACRRKLQQFFTVTDNRKSTRHQLKYQPLEEQQQIKQRQLLLNQLQGYIKMSSDVAAAAAAAITNDKLELPPLRTLDDFILGSARFQLPNLRDFEKWGKRVVKNLLYYQTNYFLMFIGIYALMIIFNPVKIACGLLVQAMLIAILLHFFRGEKSSFIAKRAATANANAQQKWYFLAGTLLFGYLLLYWFNAVLLTTFTLLLPISVTFIHASLRLRNIKNKMVNTMESFNPSTPMGVFLDTLDISPEGFLT